MAHKQRKPAAANDRFRELSRLAAGIPEHSADQSIGQADYAINDGLRQIGMLRPHGRGFEAFVLIGDELEYLAKATTRSDAIRLIREASR